MVDVTKLNNRKIYPVNDVKIGYRYYFNYLLDKCSRIFVYENLPASLPAKEIEIRLILDGYCPVVNVKNKIWAVDGGLSGIDQYYRPTTLTFAQPVLGSGNREIDKDCTIIYNSTFDIYTRIGLSKLIKRYAKLLADLDSSINILTVNRRAVFLNVAKNQVAASSVDNVMKKIQDGYYATVNENSILESFVTIPTDHANNNSLSELISAKEYILRNFYRDIGVKMALEKAERLITDEINSEEQLLLISLSNMLEEREQGVARVNEIYKTNISVKISKEFSPVEYFAEDKTEEFTKEKEASAYENN